MTNREPRWGREELVDPVVMCCVLELHHSFETETSRLVTAYGQWVDTRGCIARVTDAFPDTQVIEVYADYEPKEVYVKQSNGEWLQTDPHGAL